MCLFIQRHVDGVASVAFKEFEAAEKCVAAMNGRYYGGKQLEVHVWDGVTNYQVSCYGNNIYYGLVPFCLIPIRLKY